MDASRLEKQLVVANRLDELNTINQFLDELSEQWDIPPALTMTLHLVVEEAFTNVVQYAFADTQAHEIVLLVSKDMGLLSLVLQDDGVAYDPTARVDPDTTLAVEEREIGGLGIFLIKQMMDHVSYERVGNKNRLIMQKQL